MSSPFQRMPFSVAGLQADKPDLFKPEAEEEDRGFNHYKYYTYMIDDSTRVVLYNSLLGL
jgi:hypothetical protein